MQRVERRRDGVCGMFDYFWRSGSLFHAPQPKRQPPGSRLYAIATHGGNYRASWRANSKPEQLKHYTITALSCVSLSRTSGTPMPGVFHSLYTAPSSLHFRRHYGTATVERAFPFAGKYTTTIPPTPYTPLRWPAKPSIIFPPPILQRQQP
ncbi:hypothetical protein EJ06DRAFT_311720 [Trichodelitschia bisporula]|uniref:Uncharacterized protein n=1 Tax=Trichodelitschia bisporula TaxID=703511 RepID=A0A6G1I3I6_9PEZI|nr:hypothetical protein EJ06DRAFT_311720 [Trichodelitschia bisporula]